MHSLSGFSFDTLLERTRDLFEITMAPDGASAKTLVDELARAGKASASFYACAKDGRAALLSLKKEADLSTHPVLASQVKPLRESDVAILHGAVLEHVCGITKEAQAAKTNLFYPQDAERALGELRSGKGDVLFLMNPTPTRVVRDIAEAGEVMPQKSTFFFPKILTGLAIHTLDPSRVVAG